MKRVKVTLDKYSGRANPYIYWDGLEIRSLLQTLREDTTPYPDGLLGIRGYIIEIDNNGSIETLRVSKDSPHFDLIYKSLIRSIEMKFDYSNSK